jgi:hypothetical protein
MRDRAMRDRALSKIRLFSSLAVSHVETTQEHSCQVKSVSIYNGREITFSAVRISLADAGINRSAGFSFVFETYRNSPSSAGMLL